MESYTLMAQTTAVFVKGINGTDPILYDGKFQIAIMGRSNVGKSSVINALLGRNNLARSSSSPGKTVRMDFFLVNNSFYFVDFPGYGFARRSHKEREHLAKMILWYLLYSEIVYRMVILIIDAKVGLTDYDRDMIKLFGEKQIPYVVIANKIDMIAINEKDTVLAALTDQANGATVLPYSAKLQMFGKDIWKSIFAMAGSVGKTLAQPAIE